MKVYVIEDNPVYNDYVCNLLKKEGFDTMQAYHLSTARKLLAKAEDDDIVLADLRLLDGESIDLLRWMRANGKRQPFIVMTDYAEVHTAVESMKLGSSDYIPKRLVEDKLVPLVRSLHKMQEKKKHSQVPIFTRQGKAYQEIKRRVRLVAPTRLSVLILGENGTGKEHIAQHIHAQSKLSDKPFVPVDCGSLSPTLAQSAFFGHRKGAFTGADNDKTGYFEEADGGTLFLDEVGNLSLETQQMLLRAIQERRYRPIGAKEDKTANVRIVVATNEDLQKAVADKRFREDLFYRINTIHLEIPPLRERGDDILLFIDTFLRRFTSKYQRPDIRMHEQTIEKLRSYHWPGNIRELQHAIEKAVILCEGNVIRPKDILVKQSWKPQTASVVPNLEEVERQAIETAILQNNGNLTAAAEQLGISRQTLYNKLKRFKP